MTVSARLLFLGRKDSDHLQLEPLPITSSGWRPVSLAVHCAPWSGHFVAQFLIGELTRFGHELEFFLAGRRPAVVFKSAEHYLEMTIAKNSRDVLVVEGRACERPGSKVALEFQFELDPAPLHDLATALFNADRPA